MHVKNSDLLDASTARSSAGLTERVAYGDLAEEGLSIFDRTQALYRPMREQWTPLIKALV